MDKRRDVFWCIVFLISALFATSIIRTDMVGGIVVAAFLWCVFGLSLLSLFRKTDSMETGFKSRAFDVIQTSFVLLMGLISAYRYGNTPDDLSHAMIAALAVIALTVPYLIDLVQRARRRF